MINVWYVKDIRPYYAAIPEASIPKGWWDFPSLVKIRQEGRDEWIGAYDSYEEFESNLAVGRTGFEVKEHEDGYRIYYADTKKG